MSITPKLVDRDTGDFMPQDAQQDYRQFDLCAACTDKLIDWIEDKQEDVSASSKKSRKKPDIDHEKIKALHDAGWKPKDIAGDMSLDVTQVYNSLQRNK